MYILYFIYSLAAGIVAYFIFRSDLITLLLFLIVFETFIYLIYLNFQIKWNIIERMYFNIFFFFGYFAFFLSYEDFSNEEFYNYNNNIN
jgi:hypothetical protein